MGRHGRPAGVIVLIAALLLVSALLPMSDAGRSGTDAPAPPASGPIAAASGNGPAAGSNGSTAAAPGPAPAAPLGPSALAASGPAAEAVAAIRSAGAPMRYAFLPDFAAARPNRTAGSLVGPTYPSAPAPMGIADYGIVNRSGTLGPESLSTTGLEGTFAPTALSGLALGTGAPDYYGVQLNAVLQNVTLFGNASYSFWTQNVAEYSTFSHQLTLLDNLWNFSSPQGQLSANALLGHGANGTQVGTTYYYDVGPTITIGYPFTLRLFLAASLAQGDAVVYFNYTVQNASVTRAGSFDEIEFHSQPTGGSAPTAPPVYRADGAAPNPLGLPDDFELDLGGPGGGSNFDVLRAAAAMELDYWDAASGLFEVVPSAYNVGADTGETAIGVASTWSPQGGGALGGAPGPSVQLGTGPAFVGGAWNVSNGSGGRGTVDLTLSPGNGFLFVAPGTAPPASAYQWLPPTGPYELAPGTYSVEGLAAHHDPGALVLTVPSGGVRANLTLTSDPSTGVYTPLWAFSSAALANISSTCAQGACTLWSDEAGPLGQPGSGGPSFPWFGESNDYLFPVFPGIWLANVAEARLLTPPPLTVAPPPWEAAAWRALGAPATDALPTFFYNDTGLSISSATFANWWYAGGYLGPAAADAAVVLWNTTDSRVTNSTFLSGGEALYLYGGEANTVTGNAFLSYDPLAANAASIAGAVFGTVGIYEADPGTADRIYNNAFGTYETAIEPRIDPYTGEPPAVPYDASWNVAPAAGENIAGVAGIGGNYWWNYGTSNDPYGVLPYNASGGIATGGDADPILLAPLWSVTFVAEGLPNGTAWHVGVDTSTGFATSTSPGGPIVQYWPNGEYFVEADSANGSYGLATIGVISVAGYNVTEPLAFHRLFSLSFVGVSLPPGAFWTITVWNRLGSWIDLGNVADFPAERLPEGTYNFTVGPPPGYLARPANGVLDLVANDSLSLVFAPLGAAGAVEGSVAPAAGLALRIGGQPVALGAGGAFRVSVPAGIYAVEATAPGYLPYFNNVSVAANQTVELRIALTPSAGPAAAGTALLVAIAAAVVLAIVAAGLAVWGLRRRPPPPADAAPPAAPSPPPGAVDPPPSAER